MYAHPPREKGFFMSALEVLTTAELQLEAAGGVEKTSFVTVKVTIDEEHNTVVEGFQVSQQCMEMVAEGVLELTVHLGHCKVNPTFTVVQEGKNTHEVSFSATAPWPKKAFIRSITAFSSTMCRYPATNLSHSLRLFHG